MANNPYQVVKLISSGSFGSVFKAERDGQQVAIKQFHLASSNAIGALYFKEVDYLVRCQHPNIVKAIEVTYGLPYRRESTPGLATSTPDQLFVILPLAEASCHDFLIDDPDTPPQLSVAQKKRFMAQITSALQYLHVNDIILRDLKSNNILVFKDPHHTDTFNAVVCDMGMTKQIAPGVSNSEHVGTRSYKAPELLFESRNYGKEVDIWSLGVIFFNMFNTIYPFDPIADIKGDHKKTRETLFKMFKRRGKPNRAVFNRLSGGGNAVVRYEELLDSDGSEMKNFFEQRANHLDEFESHSASLQNFGSLEDYQDLLEKIFNLDPSKRLTVEQVFDHPFFADVPKQEDASDIWRGLKMIRAQKEEYHILTKTKQDIRSKGFPVMKKFNTGCHKLGWRILFLGMDIYERCLLAMEAKEAGWDNIESIELLAYVSIYLAAKYLLDDSIISYRQLFPKIIFDDSKIIVTEQTILISFLKWRIGRLTVYDLLPQKRKPKVLLRLLMEAGDSVYGQKIDKIAKVFSETIQKKSK